MTIGPNVFRATSGNNAAARIRVRNTRVVADIYWDRDPSNSDVAEFEAFMTKALRRVFVDDSIEIEIAKSTRETPESEKESWDFLHPELSN